MFWKQTNAPLNYIQPSPNLITISPFLPFHSAAFSGTRTANIYSIILFSLLSPMSHTPYYIMNHHSSIINRPFLKQTKCDIYVRQPLQQNHILTDLILLRYSGTICKHHAVNIFRHYFLLGHQYYTCTYLLLFVTLLVQI